MDRKKIVLLLVAIIVVATMTAVIEDKYVGERISLMSEEPVLYFEPNTPFHITHGYLWYFNMGPDYANEIRAPARTSFTLEIDGKPEKFDYLDRSVDIVTFVDDPYFEDGDYLEYSHMWLFNFEEGMEGTHTFTGQWWAPCKYIQLVCDKPNDMVLYGENSIEVHFEPAP